MFFMLRTITAMRRCGYTVRLCPICRSVRVFSVLDIQECTHLCFVPLTPPIRVGRVLICHDCRVRLWRESLAASSVHHTDDRRTLCELLSARSNLRLQKAAAEELELLRDPRAASPKLRHNAMLRPFLACEAELASKLRGGQVHRSSFASLVGGVVTGVFGATGLMLGLSEPPLVGEPMRTTLAGILLLLAAATFFYLASARYLMRYTLQPRLLRSLAPLHPNLGELTNVLAKLRDRGGWIAGRVRAESLWNLLRDLQDRQEADVHGHRG